MADAAVRLARPDDVAEIARIHRDTWRIAYADLLPERTLAALDENGAAWRAALDAPNTTVHLATEGSWTVGFCVAGLAPQEDVAHADGTLPDDAARTALIGTLLVEPRWARRGHGERLLLTAASVLREQGAHRGITWLPEADTGALAFFGHAGWQADGTVRTFDADGGMVREARVTGGLDLHWDR